MTYRVYDMAQGQFCICWDTCCRIIKSYHRARYQHEYSKEVKESQSSLLSPLSWGLPDLFYVTVDWDKVREKTTTDATSDGFKLGAFAMFSDGGVDTLVRELRRMQLETRRQNHLFQSSMKQSSDKSWSAMESSVGLYQSWIDKAKLVRDLSGSVLIACATAGTGGLTGAALFGAGTGTALKSYGKFQDTGSYGSAAIEATQNIAFSVFPAARGAALTSKETVVKLVVSVTGDTSKALLEGRSVGTALKEGALNIPVAGLGALSKKVLTPVLNKVAVPVLAQVLTAPPQIVAKLPVDVSKKIIEDRTKKSWQGAVRENPARTSAQPAGASDDSLADELSIEDDLLLKFAVIDMNKGVGRSWW
jgi:hypothetical protein